MQRGGFRDPGVLQLCILIDPEIVTSSMLTFEKRNSMRLDVQSSISRQQWYVMPVCFRDIHDNINVTEVVSSHITLVEFYQFEMWVILCLRGYKVSVS